MNASTSGNSLGSSSRNRCGMQPDTITACDGLRTSRSAADSRIASTDSSCAASMNEHVFTINASASAGSLVTSIPCLSNDPSMISASTRFLAHPSETIPTRRGADGLGDDDDGEAFLEAFLDAMVWEAGRIRLRRFSWCAAHANPG